VLVVQARIGRYLANACIADGARTGRRAAAADRLRRGTAARRRGHAIAVLAALSAGARRRAAERRRRFTALLVRATGLAFARVRAARLPMTAREVRVLTRTVIAGDRLTRERLRAVACFFALIGGAALHAIAGLSCGATCGIGLTRATERTRGARLARLHGASHAVTRAIGGFTAGATLGTRAVGARTAERVERAE